MLVGFTSSELPYCSKVAWSRKDKPLENYFVFYECSMNIKESAWKTKDERKTKVERRGISFLMVIL